MADSAPAAEAPLPPLRRAARWLALERGDFVVLVLYAIALGLLSLGVPVAVQALVNTVAFGTLMQPLIVLGALLAAVLLGAAALRMLEVRVVEFLQRRVFVRFLRDLGERVPRLSHEVLRNRDGRELLNRFFDVFALQKSLAVLLLGGIDAVLIVLVGLTVLAFYHPVLLAFDLVLLLGCGVVFFGLGRGGVQTSVAESKAKYAVVAWLQSLVASPLALKSAGAPAWSRGHSERLAADYLQARERHFRVVYRQVIAALTLTAVASVALLVLGGVLVIKRQLTLGQLVAAELIVAAVVSAIAKLTYKLETYYDMFAQIDKVGQLVDLPTEPGPHDPEPGSGPPLDEPPDLGKGQGRLVLDELRVRDDTGDMHGPLTLTLEPGTHLALPPFMSPLLDVIYGLRDAEEGHVTLNGRDRRDVTPEAWRRRVVMVRDTELWPLSLLENLRAGRCDVTRAQAWELLARVGLEKVVRGWPQGLDTPLSPDGKPFDANQAAALTLARAWLADPSVLIVDGLLDRIAPELREHLVTSILHDRQRTWIVCSHDATLRARFGPDVARRTATPVASAGAS